MISSEEPFLKPKRTYRIPQEMLVAPKLLGSDVAPRIKPLYALLINPFYPKDPYASFGKHVLTPTLAMTSFAATTPDHWQVEYWDENLLQGRPPFCPMPQVVGIIVHLTFARRAYELADWYRIRGSKVVLGGLHVLSCPEECAPRADALAIVCSFGRKYFAMQKRIVFAPVTSLIMTITMQTTRCRSVPFSHVKAF
jgi:hypothetical protein